MKLKTAILSIAAALTSTSFSATYVISNLNNPADTTNGITDSTGTSIFNQANGQVVAVGNFSITDAEISNATSAGTLIGAFQNWSTTTYNFVNAGPVGFNGYFTASTPQKTVAGTGFDGSSIYTLVGNASTLEASTEFLVLKSALTFSSSDDATPTAISQILTSANTTVLVGGFNNFQIPTRNSDGTPTASWNTVALVPEPSIALLGALGVFGLIRRRR